MKKSHAPQLFPGIGEARQLGAGARDEPVERRIDGRHEQFILILEVEVNGAVGDPGPPGNGRDPRMEESLLGDDFNGRVENALVLV